MLFVAILVAAVANIGTVACMDLLPGCPGETEVRAASSSTEMLLRVAAPCRYDRYTKPDGLHGGPTVVSTHVHVYFLGSIEAQSLFAAHLLVRFRWLDPRLAFAAHAPDVEQVMSERTLRAHIWVPKVYLVNEQQSVMVIGAQEDALVAVQPDGSVTLATRVKVTLFCMMALAKFPFDQQRCPMVFETWTYNSSQLLLQWETDGGVSVNQHLHLTEYRLLNMEPDFNMAADALAEINAPTPGTQSSSFGKQGNYSSLSVQFHLAREVGHYIMDYYVPSILLVVVSWVSFWLDPNAVPGRTTLGTSTMLTFITLTRNTGSSLPKVSYIKATEIWFIVCTAFIFGSLVEFAFVNTIWRRKQNVELKKVNSKYILKSTLTPQMSRKQIHSNMDRCQSWPSIIDKDVTGVPESPSITKDMRNFYNSGGRNTLSVDSADSIQTDPNPADGGSDVVLSVPTSGTQAHSFTTMTPQEISQWIDERSRIVFPASFVLFNVLYWGFVWI